MFRTRFSRRLKAKVRRKRPRTGKSKSHGPGPFGAFRATIFDNRNYIPVTRSAFARPDLNSFSALEDYVQESEDADEPVRNATEESEGSGRKNYAVDNVESSKTVLCHDYTYVYPSGGYGFTDSVHLFKRPSRAPRCTLRVYGFAFGLQTRRP